MFDIKTMKEMADKFADLYKSTGIKPEEFADTFAKLTPQMPKVSFNKNGYEIRTQVLEMAQAQTWQDYNAKLGAFETNITKDDDEIVTTVDLPVIPGVDQVLEAAQKFYDFVNKGK